MHAKEAVKEALTYGGGGAIINGTGGYAVILAGKRIDDCRNGATHMDGLQHAPGSGDETPTIVKKYKEE